MLGAGHQPAVIVEPKSAICHPPARCKCVAVGSSLEHFSFHSNACLDASPRALFGFVDIPLKQSGELTQEVCCHSASLMAVICCSISAVRIFRVLK